jgi:hypothetical protein
MHRAVIEYDRTVSYVEADLLLLNIARARYHRPVHFTAVSSVAATFDFRTPAGITAGFGHVSDSSERPVNLEYSARVAENPTITIVPITGEEFTKRILRPLDETKLEFLVHQGFDVNMILRIVARGIAVGGTEQPTVFFNAPSQAEGYREFRRRLLHLAALDNERKLYVGPIMYEEAMPVKLDRPPPGRSGGCAGEGLPLDAGRRGEPVPLEAPGPGAGHHRQLRSQPAAQRGTPAAAGGG